MPTDFSINTLSIQQIFSSATSNTPSVAKGVLMGQTVRLVASPLSFLYFATEELTFTVDTTDEFELEEKKEKRKIEDVLLESTHILCESVLTRWENVHNQKDCSLQSTDF